MTFKKKTLQIALGLSAFFAIPGAASAGCWWQWQGINSRLVCDNGDAGSCLSVYITTNTTIQNTTNITLPFQVKCGAGGSYTVYSLPPGHQKEFSCSQSNSCGDSSAQYIRFDASTLPGHQEKVYQLQNKKVYKFIMREPNLDLHHEP